jgi:hypothetical protein
MARTPPNALAYGAMPAVAKRKRNRQLMIRAFLAGTQNRVPDRYQDDVAAYMRRRSGRM